jgi:AI-2 transport protein TqsA
MTDPGLQPSASPVSGLGALDSFGPAARPIAMLATFVLVLLAVLALHEVSGMVVPVLFGLLLALVAAPLVGVFERRGASHRVAVTATIVVVLGVLVVTVLIIVFSIAQFVAQLPEYQDQLTDDLDALKTALANAGLPVSTDALTSIVSPSALAGIIRPLASALGSILIDVFIVLLTLSYAIVGGAGLRRRAEVGFGERHALLGGVQQFGTDLRRYLIVRAELGLFAGVLVLILLFVMGVPFPLLWAFLTFAASFIPNVGFLIALIPPTILAFLEGGFVPAAMVVIGFTAINLLQDNLLQPVVMGSELNLSPLVVFVAVIAWTWILGGAGALLAVPLTVALLAILEASPWTRGVALLMRNRADEPDLV